MSENIIVQFGRQALSRSKNPLVLSALAVLLSSQWPTLIEFVNAFKANNPSSSIERIRMSWWQNAHCSSLFMEFLRISFLAFSIVILQYIFRCGATYVEGLYNLAITFVYRWKGSELHKKNDELIDDVKRLNDVVDAKNQLISQHEDKEKQLTKENSELLDSVKSIDDQRKEAEKNYAAEQSKWNRLQQSVGEKEEELKKCPALVIGRLMNEKVFPMDLRLYPSLLEKVSADFLASWLLASDKQNVEFIQKLVHALNNNLEPWPLETTKSLAFTLGTEEAKVNSFMQNLHRLGLMDEDSRKPNDLLFTVNNRMQRLLSAK